MLNHPYQLVADFTRIFYLCRLRWGTGYFFKPQIRRHDNLNNKTSSCLTDLKGILNGGVRRTRELECSPHIPKPQSLAVLSSRGDPGSQLFLHSPFIWRFALRVPFTGKG